MPIELEEIDMVEPFGGLVNPATEAMVNEDARRNGMDELIIDYQLFCNVADGRLDGDDMLGLFRIFREEESV